MPNSTRRSLMAEQTQYCWLADDQEESEDFYPDDDLSLDCLFVYEIYCDLDPDRSSPKISGVLNSPKLHTPDFQRGARVLEQ
ncbi:hypothetical protein N7463_000418 [Penicillium fimorum]|uniref:Uncharacterized protein n=1 Tax=Penicillium fimorum TaxID=1882269 RepID=A0A9W9Y492_9EURO|nr:hypothetical protein N7463_000418 [Penicillium fimorum]